VGSLFERNGQLDPADADSVTNKGTEYETLPTLAGLCA
jgi:hypothetical protein